MSVANAHALGRLHRSVPAFGDTHVMKVCKYCGRENDDEAVHCRECGTQEFKTPAAETAPPELPDTLPESAEPKGQFRELTPEEMKMDFVTLMTCRTVLEADMIVGQLGSAGIPAFIPDEFLSQAVSWNLNTYDYVRVQVSPKDYESAKEFLLASPEDAEPGAAPNGGPAMPSANSGATEGPPSVS